ncbi:MAG: hypothetical protein JEZ09_18065 [Salinivirgaceae bacterium]|nr:hypothetical protein [Salinivirgaceae bacterium]
MTSSEECDDFYEAYDKYIEIGLKRSKEYFIVRTGTSERKSRMGDEIHLYFITPDEYIETLYLGQPYNNSYSPLQNNYSQPQTFNITHEELNNIINTELGKRRKQTEYEQLLKEQEQINELKAQLVHLRRIKYNIDDTKAKAIQKVLGLHIDKWIIRSKPCHSFR